MALYYVSLAGNDSNAGTSAGAPWLTVSKVNTVALNAGDTVFFRGGDAFSGNLLISPGNAPTAVTRINVTSYGTGFASINGGNSYAVKALNCGYVSVYNINLIGATVSVSGTYPNKTATTTSTTPVLLFEASTTNVWYLGVIVDVVDITGGLLPMRFLSSNTSATAAYEGFRVTNCKFHDGGITGFMTNGTGTGSYPHDKNGILFRYGYIADCQAYDNYGITAYDWGFAGGGPIQTGFGFFLINCQDTLVERCWGTRLGIASYNLSPGGPVAVIFVECTRCTMRRCEGSYVYASSGVDGEAFDLDGGCLDCVIEDCYAHNCEGPAFLVYQYGAHSTHSGSIIRGCIVEDCAQKNNTVLTQGDGTGTVLVEHCTFFHTKNASGPAAIIDASSADIRNSILSVRSGGTFGVIDAGSLNGNTYHVGSGSSFSLVFNAVTYTSLAAMQAAGLEKIGAVLTGAAGNPQFANPGAAAACLPASQVSLLTNYDLGNGSVAQNAGVNLLQFGKTPRPVDWHNNPAIANETDVLSGIDSGAVRKGSTVWIGFAGVR